MSCGTHTCNHMWSCISQITACRVRKLMLVFILFYLISASIVLGVEVLEAMRDAAAWLGANQKRWDVCQHPPMHTHTSLFGFIWYWSCVTDLLQFCKQHCAWNMPCSNETPLIETKHTANPNVTNPMHQPFAQCFLSVRAVLPAHCRWLALRTRQWHLFDFHPTTVPQDFHRASYVGHTPLMNAVQHCSTVAPGFRHDICDKVAM